MQDIYLTKTDFIHYLRCPKSLWLFKHRPHAYPHRAFSDFLKKITREGYEVEKYAQQLFFDAQSLPTGSSAEQKTAEAIAGTARTLFQPTFRTTDGMFVRADILERHDDGTWTLYEVKSSSKVKQDKKHNHIKDACFQIIALEKSGLRIRDVCILHVNPDYVRGAAIEPHLLLRKARVTDAVAAIQKETEDEVTRALTLLAQKDINETCCSCFFTTRNNHCDAFRYFNAVPAERTVWEIIGIREKKLRALLERDVQRLADVPDDIELNTAQRLQVRSAVIGKAIVAEKGIADILDSFDFPLYFLDYETASNAVPKSPGMRPWQHIPFQYSLHILQKDDSLTHEEYLSDSLDGIDAMLRCLQKQIGPVGSVVSWHASFEKQRNREMGVWYPEHNNALLAITGRMVDLKDVFKEAYVDVAFCGSQSIKNVLPVLCPDLSYADMQIKDGTQAMERWLTMVDGGVSADTAAAIRNDLLAYCKLDTYAMVVLYRKLRDLVRDAV